MGSESLQELKAELFRALAHSTRIRILELLRVGEMSVSELEQRLGIEAASVSQHLGVLRGQDLVSARREGSSVFYRLREPKIVDLLDTARMIFDHRLAALQLLSRQAADQVAPERVDAGPPGASGTPLGN